MEFLPRVAPGVYGNEWQPSDWSRAPPRQPSGQFTPGVDSRAAGSLGPRPSNGGASGPSWYAEQKPYAPSHYAPHQFAPSQYAQPSPGHSGTRIDIPPEEAATVPRMFEKYKWIILGLVVFIVAAVLVWWFFFKSDGGEAALTPEQAEADTLAEKRRMVLMRREMEEDALRQQRRDKASSVAANAKVPGNASSGGAADESEGESEGESEDEDEDESEGDDEDEGEGEDKSASEDENEDEGASASEGEGEDESESKDEKAELKAPKTGKKVSIKPPLEAIKETPESPPAPAPKTAKQKRIIRGRRR